MRLNIDCVRDIMLWAELLTTPTSFAKYVDVDAVKAIGGFLFDSSEDVPVPDIQQKELLAKYDNATLVYHLYYCIKAGLLVQNDDISDNMNIFIKDLTPLGHDFIGNIREVQNYSPAKAIAKKAGVETLNAFIDIGKEVAKLAIVTALKQ